jgi:hypothetical protein
MRGPPARGRFAAPRGRPSFVMVRVLKEMKGLIDATQQQCND